MDKKAEILQKAYQLIKSGEKQQALDLLTPIIRAEPDHAEAWYLLAHALTDPEKRIYAFEQVLRLDPENQSAQKQLAKLRHAPAVETVTPEAPISLDAPITPEVLAKNARVANAEMRKLLPWVAAIGFVLCLCLGAIAFGFWWALRDMIPPAPVTIPVSATATQAAVRIQSSTPAITTTRGPFLTATQRPSVTPYPRRATGTPVPTSTPPVSLANLTAGPTANMTAIVLVQPSAKKSAVSVSKSGVLSLSQSISIPFDIDNHGKVDFVLSWPVKQPLVFTLTSPDGQLIDQAYAKDHPAVAVFSSTKNGFIYSINAPAVGEWKVNMAASGAGKYEVMAHFVDTTLILQPGSDKLKYTSGELANVAVRLVDDGVGLPGATIMAKVKAPGSNEQNAALIDQGDGFYGFTYLVPRASGTVVFTVIASGENNAVKFTRVITFSIEIKP